MTRKELHTGVISLVKQQVADPEVEKNLCSGIDLLFKGFGESWLKRNGATIGNILLLYLPKLLKLFIKK